MTAVFITVYRQRTQPKINEERSVQGQINQIIHTDEMLFLAKCIPISELGCEKIALYSFIYIAHKTLMMY